MLNKLKIITKNVAQIKIIPYFCISNKNELWHRHENTGQGAPAAVGAFGRLSPARR